MTVLPRTFVLLVAFLAFSFFSTTHSLDYHFQYSVAHSNFFGRDLTFATFEIDFSEDLYFMTPRFCLPYCKPFQNTTEEKCDYSPKNELCGVSSDPNATCQYQKQLCNDNTDYQQLKNGTVIKNNFIPSVQTKYFRFFLDRPCAGFKIHFDRKYGKFWYAIKRGVQPLTHLTGEWDRLTNIQDVTYCPQEVNFGYGTWFVGVWTPAGNPLLFDISLEIFDLDMNNARPVVNSSDRAINGNQFLFMSNFGESVYTSMLRRTLYTFRLQVPSCFTFMIHREIISYQTPQTVAMHVGPEVGFTATRWMYLRWFTPAIVHVCPTPGVNLTLLHFNLFLPDSNLVLQFYLSNITSEWNPEKVPVASMNPWSGEENLEGLFQVVCPHAPVFLCDPGTSDLGSSCNELWISMPRKDGNPLWPIPRMFLDDQLSGVEYVDPENSSVLLGNQLRASLLLEYYYKTQSEVTLTDWTHTLSQCVLVFNFWSMIATESGEFLMQNITVGQNEKNSTCSAAAFRELSQELDNFTQLLIQATELSDQLTLRFQMDVLTFVDPWQICDTRIRNQFLDTVAEYTSFPESKLCNSAMMKNSTVRKTDPCCNDTLNWQACCLPRVVGTTKESLQRKSDLSAVGCKNSDCVQTLLSDYIFYDQVVNSIRGCGAVVTETLAYARWRNMEFYRQCKNESFGSDFQGISCANDSDCGTNRCDVIRKKCVWDSNQRNESYYQFFQCLVNTMPASLKEAFVSKYLEKDLADVSQTEIIDALYRNFTAQACMGDFARSMDGAHFVLVSSTGVATCGPNDWHCLDWTCPVPLRSETEQQYGRPRATCKRYKGAAGSPTCEAYSCNWASALIDEDFNQTRKDMCLNHTNGFCSVCESTGNCIEIPELSQAECGKRFVCINGNGQYRLDIDNEEDCRSLFGNCSLPCPGCNRDSCEQSGYCSDQEIKPYVTILGQPPAGYCTGRMTPWNFPDCTQPADGTAIPISILGADFPRDALCFRFQNSSNCAKYAYDWHTFATNKQQCEQFTSCEEPNVIHTTLKTIKSPAVCTACQGEIKSSFQWTAGQWQEGAFRSTQWQTPQYENIVYFDLGVNFADLDNFFESVVVGDYAKQLVTEAECRWNPTKQVMERILCVCDNGLDQCSSSLDSSQISLGVVQVCPYKATNFVAPPSAISFGDNSTTECVDIVGYSPLEQNLKSSTQSRLSLSFRKDSKTQLNVWNHNGATIGNTAGNGILLILSPSNVQLRDVSVCLTFNIPSSIDQLTVPTRDLGWRSGNKVYPLGLTLYQQDSVYCVDGLTITSDNNEFYPIWRDQDWENKSETQTYSDGQKIIYAVVLVLYFGVLCGLCSQQVTMGGRIQANRIFDFFLIAAVLVRCLYFLLLLILQPTGEESVAEFLGLEFPTFAYLSTVSLGAMLWALVKASSIEQSGRSMNAAAIKFSAFALNVLLYILLIVVTIIFFELKGKSSTSCFSHIYSEPSTSPHDTLRIVYVSIISAVTICLVFMLMYYGGSVAVAFSLMKTTGTSSQKLKVWLGVTIIMAFSVLLQCIFMLIYSLALTPSYEYALVLILIEIIPITFAFALQLKTGRDGSKRSTDDSNNTIVPDKFSSKVGSASVL